MEDSKLIKKIKHLKVTACVCGCTTFLVMGEPLIAEGRAQIRMLICANSKCKIGVDVSDNGKLGTKKTFFDLAPIPIKQKANPPIKPSTFSIDEEGKKHYVMHCETGNLGVGLQKD